MSGKPGSSNTLLGPSRWLVRKTSGVAANDLVLCRIGVRFIWSMNSFQATIQYYSFASLAHDCLQRVTCATRFLLRQEASRPEPAVTPRGLAKGQRFGRGARARLWLTEASRMFLGDPIWMSNITGGCFLLAPCWVLSTVFLILFVFFVLFVLIRCSTSYMYMT